MIKTPSTNAFISDEEKRIRTLAYYGEFFANLDFDDGFKSIVLKQLLDYISSLETVDISCEQEETADMIKVIIESESFEENTAKDIFEITTKLQSDFCMTPLLQSYPFKLDDEITLPVRVKTKSTDGIYFHRQVIQTAQAEILRLEKQLQNLHFRIDILWKNTDATLVALLESWQILIPEIKDRVKELKTEFQNLIAQKYIELASLENWNEVEKDVSLSLFQADVCLEKPKTLYSKIWELEWKIDNIIQVLINKTGDTSIETGNTKSKTWILRNIRETGTWYFIDGTISGSRQQVYHNGEKIVGFELDGIDKILDIKDMNIDKGVLQNFDVVLENDVVQYFYLGKKWKYEVFSIEGKTDFKRITVYNNNNKAFYWDIINIDDTHWYFYLEDWEYKLLNINGRTSFNGIHISKLVKRLKIYNPRLPSWQIKNKNNNWEYFYTEDWEYKIFTLDGEHEFDSINIEDSYADWNPIKGTINVNWEQKKFNFRPSLIEKILLQGTDIKRLW